MNFSLTQGRAPIQPETFNPGPGYYVTTNDPKYAEMYRISFPNFTEHKGNMKSSFPKGERFATNPITEAPKPGPGQYRGVDDWGKEGRRMNRNMFGNVATKQKNSQPAEKTIPSIPSKGMLRQFVEGEDGKVVLVKEVLIKKPNNDHLGPGSYDYSMDPVKQTFKSNIKFDLHSSKRFQDFDKNKHLGPGTYTGDLLSMGTQSPVAGDPAQKTTGLFRVFKKTKFDILSQGDTNLESRIQDNLSTDYLRMAANNRSSAKDLGPGAYFDPQKASSFQVVSQNKKFNGYVATSKRFGEGEWRAKLPGPGYYNEQRGLEMLAVKKSAFLDGAPRRSEHLKEAPGPGYYDAKLVKDIKTFNTSTEDLKYAPVFGVGAKRFVDFSDQTPGPGSYSTKDIFKKKKTRRQRNRSANSSVSARKKPFIRGEESRVEQGMPQFEGGINSILDPTRLENVRTRDLLGDKPLRRNPGSAAFVSKVSRFKNRAMDDQFVNLGPGSYDPRLSEKPSFNQYSVFNRSLRGTDIVEMAETKAVGPGHYNPNYDVTKEKRTIAFTIVDPDAF